METVRIEHIAGAGSVVGADALALANGDAIMGDCGADDPSVSTALNGQLEIEIPAGDARQGAIHTIQLQSPGGNTHIVEGLVVTSGGGSGGEVIEGETTLFQGPGGTFILPTTNHHNNNLAMVTSPSGNTCEVITADSSDHHILSGLQVVRVTTGENGETIFLVPSTGHDKDGMPQVMVLQSAEDISEEHQVPAEMVEESVELNIPSPKPILTQVKQEAGIITANGDDNMLNHHQHHQYQPNTLVVVTGSSNGNLGQAPSPTEESQQQQLVHPVTGEVIEQKPALSTVNGHTTVVTTGTATVTTAATTSHSRAAPGPGRLPNGSLLPPPATVSADDRPKRKAAIKAVATRKAALASVHSPRKSNPQRSPKTKPKVEVTPLVDPPKPVVITRTTTQVGAISRLSTNKNPQVLSIVSTSSLGGSSTTGSSGGTLTNLPGPHHPPPPPVNIPPPPIVHRLNMPGTSNAMQTGGSGGANRNFYLLPEDMVSESEDEGEGGPLRKCVVCLRRRRFTADVFDPNQETILPGGFGRQHQISQHIDILIAHLNIPIKGKPSEVGICPSCLDALQRWHIFNCTVVKRHEAVKSSGAPFDDTPLNQEAYETRIYRNYRKMSKVKEVYRGATHAYLARRCLTEKDWDFFCDNLFRFNSVRSERARELEKYIMCREKLTHIYCVKCQRLVKNGRKGFVKHMKSQHPNETILFPCDICGNHFPEKDTNANTEEYYAHWIAHFYFNTCDECGKRFPTKRSLGQHRHSVHKNRTTPWNAKNAGSGAHSSSTSGLGSEDRPWKCEQCDASFKMKGALMSHRDVVHYNLKNHVCNMCGEAFKSASSLRGHVRRHEGRRDYKCEVCHKEYYTYSALKGHKVVHQTARDFICGICGKAFKKKKALEEHGTLHTGVKPHRCPICGREIRVKSNLYKHMKIHKKNAELGITTGRGRHHHLTNSNSNSNSPSSSTSTTPTKTLTAQQTKKAAAAAATATTSTTPNTPVINNVIRLLPEPPKPKVKQIKVEDRILEVKQEPGLMATHSFSSASTSSTATVRATVNSNGTITASPIQGTTAMDVVLENASELGANSGEHRGPIVVSIVTDGLSGGPGDILQMDPEQQARLLSAVTSLATSQGQTVTVAQSSAGGPTTFIASPMVTSTVTAAPSNSSTSTVTSATSSTQQDPILGVSNTQYYTNTQQFFTSLDQLQN